MGINKEMKIGEVVEKYPEVVEVLLSYGVHCVGCHVSQYESIEEGLKGHGMTSEKVDEVVEKLNEYVKEEELSLSLTDRAVSKVRTLMVEGKNKALRIKVEAGGCSGNEYVFSLEKEDPREGDLVIVQDSGVVFVDKNSLTKINGSVLDYEDNLQGAGFKISNPNATKVCGCGSSFS